MIRADAVLSRIRPGDLVLDVGGWASPFNRANWILDCEPFETRGYYKTIGLPQSQGGEVEHFTKDTWLQRDICERTPWPFPDKFFDFSICAGTLEDLRDPIFVCSELVRVSKAGYIETPSMLAESCRGWESNAIAGLSHHRWLVDYLPNELVFCMKFHMIHESPELSLPPSVYRGLSVDERMDGMFWEDSFKFSELMLIGLEPMRAYLRERVERHSHRITAEKPTDQPSYQELSQRLVDTVAERDALRQRLAPLEEIGATSLAFAKRLRRASLRYPRAASLVRGIRGIRNRMAPG
jgi:hypothetical protein